MTYVIMLISGMLGFILMFAGTGVSFFDILIICVGIYTAIQLLYKRNISWIWDRSYNKILLCFSVLSLVIMTYIPRESYVSTLTTIYLIAVYFLVYYWNAKEGAIKKTLIAGYMLGALLSSLIGAIVYLVRLSMPTYSHLPFFWKHDVRISGFFDDPVVYGAFLVPALILLFYTYLYSESSKKQWWSLLGLLLVYLNIILTGSRGAWLNVCVALAVFVILDKRLRDQSKIRLIIFVGIIFSVLLYVVVFLVPLQGQTYYNATLRDRHLSSDGPRIQSWESAPELIKNRPILHGILGSGGGMFEQASEQKLGAHNVYISTIYEYGIIGFSLIILFFGFIIRQLVHNSRVPHISSNSVIVLALVAGVLVQGMFVDILHWRHLWIIVALL